MIQLLLQADPGDGNDALEETVSFPAVPRRGELIEVWDKEAWGGQPAWLKVEQVTWCAWHPSVTVTVSMEGYNRDMLARVMAAAGRGDQP